MSSDASQTDSTSSQAGDAASNPFAAGLGASLGFFQDWMKAAGQAMPAMQSQASGKASPLSGLNSMSAWTMPTLDPQELEKRISDLKTVQFWLEQNARMIGMTIQGLEVQRMTLATLRGMNVSMDALRESLKARPDSSSTESKDKDEEKASSSSEGPGQGINPMQWWDTLTQQFTQLASQATQASVDVGSAATQTMETMAQAAASATASATAAAASAAEAVQKATPGPAAAQRGAAAHPPKRKESGKPDSDAGTQ